MLGFRTHFALFLAISATLLRADPPSAAKLHGLTGSISDLAIAVPAPEQIQLLSDTPLPADIDLKQMASWAMNYLARTPRPDRGYEPVFQCHPLQCPPVPAGADPVVPCDTDARMDWEWYYMRDITGSTAARDIEAAFHKRIRSYIAPDGKVYATPGAFNEGNIHANYTEADRIIHIWGATKVLQSLSEDYSRTKNPESKRLAQKVMLALKSLATWDEFNGEPRCYIKCGMGALHPDGSVVPNGWNRQPAPIVEPLLTYYLSTGDPEGLSFARAYAEGMITGAQPDGIRFSPDGSFAGHSHATMHAVWGVAHLGLLTSNPRYTDFAKRSWDYLLTRGTGTGWFPAAPDSCNETCCISDMISIATLLGQAGHTDYYDNAERYLRNYISNLQFIVTPEFEKYYHQLNASKGDPAIAKGLDELRKFQGGIIGGSGLNDYENDLLGNVSGFEMFGCCAPEGMRAIHTIWSSTIQHLDPSPLGPAGVYVNMSFSRSSPYGQVVSFMPDAGRLTVKAAVADTFFLRPPSWTPRDQVHAFLGNKSIPPTWSGDYLSFNAHPGDQLTITYPLLSFTQHVQHIWPQTAPNLQLSFHWLGNMVLSANPAPAKTALFLGKPRILPPAPAL
ncbi:MAG TPA: hypothetical protein VFE58_04335 [Tepidisphaeraceae bacterium]|jgi:hypothetical protein|nr:hypothetical protein [Tepidisphaeraceae bacterium]